MKKIMSIVLVIAMELAHAQKVTVQTPKGYKELDGATYSGKKILLPAGGGTGLDTAAADARYVMKDSSMQMSRLLQDYDLFVRVGDSLVASGFKVSANGDTLKTDNNVVVYPTVVGDGWTYRYTTVDTAQNSSVGRVVYELSDINLAASSLYEFEAQLYFTTDATNALGVKALITSSSAPTAISGVASWPLNAGVGSGLLAHDVQSSNTDTVGVSAFASTLVGNVPMPMVYYGRVLTNGSATLRVVIAGETVTSPLLTLIKGSYIKVRKIY